MIPRGWGMVERYPDGPQRESLSPNSLPLESPGELFRVPQRWWYCWAHFLCIASGLDCF